jgi:Ca-activated chloride channel family protein
MTWSEPRWLLLAAAAVALLPVAWLMARRRRLQQERVASRRLWLRWHGGAPATGGLRAALWLLAAAAAGVAAAGPRWGRPLDTAVPTVDIVVALDVSDSMACTDVAPDRLTRAKDILRQVLDRLSGATWGLAIGAGTARPLVPLTTDVPTLGQRLADPGLRRWVAPGSNLAALLGAAGSLLPAGGGGRVILLATDGEQLEGDAARVADGLRRSGIAIVSLLCGTASGAPVPRLGDHGAIVYARDAAGNLARSRAHVELLRTLVGDPHDLVDASSAAAPGTLAQVLRRAAHESAAEVAPVHSGGFVLLAALLATASFLSSPWRRVALAAVVLPSTLAAAPPPASQPSAWGRLVPGHGALLAREAHRAAARGAWGEAVDAYARAVALKPDDRWLRLALATSRARTGDHAGEVALEELAATPALAYAAWFNLGTSRLLRGDLVGAERALRRAVVADPSRKDAWHNLELALAGLRQKRAGSSPPTAGESRERLVEQAARAALQPLLVRGPTPPAGQPGRDW